MFLSVYKSAREVDMEAILPAFPVYLPGMVHQYYVFFCLVSRSSVRYGPLT